MAIKALERAVAEVSNERDSVLSDLALAVADLSDATSARDKLSEECATLSKAVSDLSNTVTVSRDRCTELETELSATIATCDARCVELTADVHEAWEVSDHLGVALSTQHRTIERVTADLESCRIVCTKGMFRSSSQCPSPRAVHTLTRLPCYYRVRGRDVVAHSLPHH